MKWRLTEKIIFLCLHLKNFINCINQYYTLLFFDCMYLFLQMEAKALNKKEVLEEDRVKNLPKNHEEKQRRLKAEMEQDKIKQAMAEQV